ncbi:MAG: hypothetical protein ACYTDV_20745, partial [Planctomycetota bacterium]
MNAKTIWPMKPIWTEAPIFESLIRNCGCWNCGCCRSYGCHRNCGCRWNSWRTKGRIPYGSVGPSTQ